MVRHFCDRCKKVFERDGAERYMNGKYSYILLQGIGKKRAERRIALCSECYGNLIKWLKCESEEKNND